MRLANIIIAHKDPQQLERLIEKMTYPGFDFYIHLDKKIDIKHFEYLKLKPNVHFITNRIECNWGGYSTLEAMVGSLKEVLTNEIHYGFYNLLSAQDYPIKSNKFINQFYENNADKSFIYYEEGSVWWSGGLERFQRYHLTDFNFKGKYVLERLINLLTPKRKFPFEGKLYGGSKASWWSLNQEAATYLLEFFSSNVKLGRFLRFCWGTDEFVIPTILMNSPFRDQVVNDNLRYIKFPPGMANPQILDVDDFDDIKRSDMLFARKFDQNQSTILLDKIDQYIESE